MCLVPLQRLDPKQEHWRRFLLGVFKYAYTGENLITDKEPGCQEEEECLVSSLTKADSNSFHSLHRYNAYN